MSNLFHCEQQVRFSDIDSYQHVNNVAFLTYLEDARIQLMHAPVTADGVQTTLHELIGPEFFTLVARHSIEYLAPLEFRTTPIQVTLWISRIGNSSYNFGYRVAESDQSVSYAQAETTMVLVSRATGRPEAVSQAQRTALDFWFDDSSATASQADTTTNGEK